MNFIAPGIGAGLVSALLTALLMKQTLLAALLHLLAPFPILIVSLGWNHRSGLVATLTGSVAVGLFVSPMLGLAFAAATALPAWWLAYLSLLGRPGPDGTIEWYPLGRILVWIAVTAALTMTATGLLSAQGDYDKFFETSQRFAEAIVSLQFASTGPNALDPQVRTELIGMLARFVPFMSALGFTVVLSLFLWSAARSVQISGRLPRPWPNVPDLDMPRAVILALAGAFALIALGGFIGVFGAALAGALVMAFALQGLALIHGQTRGKPGRVFLLTVVYLLIFMSQGILMTALALLGLADTLFGLRRRFGGGGLPPSTLST